MTNLIKKEVQEKVKKPDVLISAKKTFNISWEIEVPAFSQKDAYVPDVDENYYFEEDTTRAVYRSAANVAHRVRSGENSGFSVAERQASHPSNGSSPF